MKKALLFAMIIFCCSPLSADEITDLVSPDGKLRCDYILNGKTNEVLNRLQSYDTEEYELVIKNIKTKKIVLNQTGLFWIDKIAWTPDSKLIMIQKHTRYSKDIMFIEVATGAKNGLDFWRYVLENKDVHGFELSGDNPYLELDFFDWEDKGKVGIFEYVFNGAEKRYSGKLFYNYDKCKIVKLVPDVEETDQANE